MIQSVQVELKKVRINSLLKPDRSKGCYIKTQNSQEKNNQYVYMHCFSQLDEFTVSENVEKSSAAQVQNKGIISDINLEYINII